ncbi:unnamed protein product, partial [Rotaria sp. Silwood1]
CNT